MRLTMAPDGDWLLIDRRSGSGSGGDAFLEFERTLLDGLFYGNSLVRLSGIGETFLLPMDQMRNSSAAMRSGITGCAAGAKASEHLAANSCCTRSTTSAANWEFWPPQVTRPAMEGLAPDAMLFGITRTSRPQFGRRGQRRDWQARP